MEALKTTIKKASDTMQVQAQLLALLPELEKGKTFDVEIKVHREKRSKNANDYSWLLQSKIAKALNRPLDEIHKQMVFNYGVVEVLSVIEEASESARRCFDYSEILGTGEVKGKKFVHLKVGVGTHNYNTKEMSEFLNGVVAEAKDLGIETLEEREIKTLMHEWENGKR